jgi:hypothetical protein
VWIAIGLGVAVVAFVVLIVLARNVPRVGNSGDGTYAQQFVYIENDGTARELTEDEKEYLNTEFHPTDGARPYIKFRYRSLTPDGKMHGFLWRRRLPRGMPVAKPPRQTRIT